jgi:hypothetical protein
MSMNMHCKEVDLIQTPTHITYMCLYADLGKKTLSPWKTILEKYVLYCQSIANRNQEWEHINAHIKHLKSYKILHFSIV